MNDQASKLKTFILMETVDLSANNSKYIQFRDSTFKVVGCHTIGTQNLIRAVYRHYNACYYLSISIYLTHKFAL